MYSLTRSNADDGVCKICGDCINVCCAVLMDAGDVLRVWQRKNSRTALQHVRLWNDVPSLLQHAAWLLWSGPNESTYVVCVLSVFTVVAFLSYAVFTHRRSVVKRGGCFQRRLFVCQFVRSRSKVKVTRDKKTTAESSPLTMHSRACAVARP